MGNGIKVTGVVFVLFLILNITLWMVGQLTGIDPVQGLLALIVIGVFFAAYELINISKRLERGGE